MSMSEDTVTSDWFPRSVQHNDEGRSTAVELFEDTLDHLLSIRSVCAVMPTPAPTPDPGTWILTCWALASME